MTLSGKFGILRRKMKFDEMPREQALFGQGCYLAGAQAAFQILAAASDKTREEAVMIWAELQNEIMAAIPKMEGDLAELKPEKSLIV